MLQHVSVGESGSSRPEGATDPDGDDLYEDLHGNEETDFADVVALFQDV